MLLPYCHGFKAGFVVDLLCFCMWIILRYYSLVSKRLQKFLKFAWKYSEKEKEIYNMYIQNFP
jgi:hypothetical protein